MREHGDHFIAVPYWAAFLISPVPGRSTPRSPRGYLIAKVVGQSSSHPDQQLD